MRHLMFIPVMLLFIDLQAQEVTISRDSVYGEGFKDNILIRTDVVKFDNWSDSTYKLTIKQIASNRDSLSWERTLLTHYLTYTPNVDSISFELKGGDTGRLIFEFYPDNNAGCIQEKYEILQSGPSQHRDTLDVRACGLESLSVHMTSSKTQVYPVPADRELFVQIKPELLDYDYSIINESGQIIQKGNLRDHTNCINTSEMNDGHYFLWISGVEYSIPFILLSH